MARSLTTIAGELKRQSAAKRGGKIALPAFLFMTDAARTPNPWEVIRRLPEDTAVIFRHYEVENRAALAGTCAAAARKRGLLFLVAEDLALAREVGADGLHLPESAVSNAAALRAEWPEALITAAIHSQQALQTLTPDIDAILLSPVFPTPSHPGARTLGLDAASALAAEAPCPAYALGGITDENAETLLATDFCGIAGISCFLGK